MTTLPVITEPTQLLRDWLRGKNVGGIGARVWAGGLPTTGGAPTLPAIVVHRIPGGGVDIPVETVTYQFDCFAAQASVASALAAELVTLLLAYENEPLSSSVRFLGWVDQTLTCTYQPDPDDPSIHRVIIPSAQAVFITIS